MNDETKDKLIEYLEHEEGNTLHIYKDRHGWSIGRGHWIGNDDAIRNFIKAQKLMYTYDPPVPEVINPNFYKYWHCTHAQSDDWFFQDLANAINEKESTFPWWPVDGARGAALVALIYQMGLPSVQGFHKMLSRVRLAVEMTTFNPPPDIFWESSSCHALDSTGAKQTPARALRVAIELIGKNTWPEWK